MSSQKEKKKEGKDHGKCGPTAELGRGPGDEGHEKSKALLQGQDFFAL